MPFGPASRHLAVRNTLLLAASCMTLAAEPALARGLSFDGIETYVKQAQAPRRAGLPTQPTPPIALPGHIRPDPIDIADAIEIPVALQGPGASEDVVCLAGCVGRRGTSVYTRAGSGTRLAAAAEPPVARPTAAARDWGVEIAIAAPSASAEVVNQPPQASRVKRKVKAAAQRQPTPRSSADVAAAASRPAFDPASQPRQAVAAAPAKLPSLPARRRPQAGQLALHSDTWTRQVFDTILR